VALPKRIDNWPLTSLQQRLVKRGGQLVKHARYYWVFLAEGHLNRRRFGAMLGRIAVETLPNSEQPIVPANRRRQIPGEVVAVNQTRGRMQKYRRGRRDACIEHAQ
jgi:hypothetical protein